MRPGAGGAAGLRLLPLDQSDSQQARGDGLSAAVMLREKPTWAVWPNLEEERVRLYEEINRARADLDRREAALEKRELALQEEKAAHREQVREDRAQAREEAAARREEMAHARLESERVKFEAAEARGKLESELRAKLELAQARLESELMSRVAQPPSAAEDSGSFGRRRPIGDHGASRPEAALYGGGSSHRASHEEPALDYMHPMPPPAMPPPREHSFRGTRRSSSQSERPSLSRRPTGVIVEEMDVLGEAESVEARPEGAMAVMAPSSAPPHSALSAEPAPSSASAATATVASTLPPPGRYAAFVSHYKLESAMEARYVQNELEQKLGRQVFLDSDDLRDLRQLQEHVRQSEVSQPISQPSHHHHPMPSRSIAAGQPAVSSHAPTRTLPSSTHAVWPLLPLRFRVSPRLSSRLSSRLLVSSGDDPDADPRRPHPALLLA